MVIVPGKVVGCHPGLDPGSLLEARNSLTVGNCKALTRGVIEVPQKWLDNVATRVARPCLNLKPRVLHEFARTTPRQREMHPMICRDRAAIRHSLPLSSFPEVTNASIGRSFQQSHFSIRNPLISTNTSLTNKMGGLNLEVFKVRSRPLLTRPTRGLTLCFTRSSACT